MINKYYSEFFINMIGMFYRSNRFFQRLRNFPKYSFLDLPLDGIFSESRNVMYEMKFTSSNVIDDDFTVFY